MSFDVVYVVSLFVFMILREFFFEWVFIVFIIKIWKDKLFIYRY